MPSISLYPASIFKLVRPKNFVKLVGLWVEFGTPSGVKLLGTLPHFVDADPKPDMSWWDPTDAGLIFA